MLVDKKDYQIIHDKIGIKKNKMTGKKIVLFGCTLFSQDICDVLLENNLKPYAFVDNNDDKIGGKCMGLEVYKPSDLLAHSDKYYVIVCSKYHNEMIGQLKSLGLSDDSMLDIPVGEARGDVSDDIDLAYATIEEVKKGYSIYKGIRKEREKLLLCPYPGTGDIYMACTWLRIYLERNSIAKYRVVITRKSALKVVKLFGDIPTTVITTDDMHYILKAWEFLGTEMMDVKPLLYWGWRTKRYFQASKCTQINFADLFCHDTYGFVEKYTMDRPMCVANKKMLEDFLVKHDLKQGKTAILAPYAGSFNSLITLEEWEEVADNLGGHGYIVFTNCAGEEKPICGTEPIFFSYDMAIDVMEYAGLFIGVRSGLCDIISSAKCKQIIIYESGFAASNYNYFSLVNMGLNPDAKEIVYGNDKRRLWEMLGI